MRRRMLVAGLISAALFAPVASAAPPTTETEEFEFSLDIDCGTFVLTEDLVFRTRTTTFYDDNGDATRVQLQAGFMGIITAPDGTTVRDFGHFTETRDLTEGSVRVVGIPFNYVVPGHGGVAQDRGFILIEPDGDVIVHGPHEIFSLPSQDVAELLCPLFT
jgi:hypothetical protein